MVKQKIEEQFKAKEDAMDESCKDGDLNKFWSLWSEALERGYLEHITDSKKIDKTKIGRGKMTIIEMGPRRKDVAKDAEDVEEGGAGSNAGAVGVAHRERDTVSEQRGDQREGD